MRHHKGKTFLAPPGLFKAERALYFPNLRGQTLVKKSGLRDTTPVLKGNVSVVSVFNSAWAENQAATFTSLKKNPELHELLKIGAEDPLHIVRRVSINIENNTLKAWIIKLFMPFLRKRMGPNNWSQYFLVRKGITDEIRDAIGLLNSKVGYTYLVDANCKIRWAGSGVSEGDENQGLVKGLQRLIDERKKEREEEKRRTSERTDPSSSSMAKVANAMSSKKHVR